MSKSHFEPTMTRPTQANQVVEHIRFVFELEVPTAFDVVYVKLATAWTALHIAIMANLVTFPNEVSDALPVATKGKFFAAAPVSAILANHEVSSACLGAKPSPVLNGRWEGLKRLGAVLASLHRVLFGRLILALARAMANLSTSWIERLFAMFAWNRRHSCAFPCLMTVPRTKGRANLPTLDSVRWTFERLATMVAFQRHVIASVGTTLTAMVDRTIARFELFFAMETYLDHCFG